MDWVLFITNIISKIPVERVIFRPRDNIKALEEVAATLTAPQTAKEAPTEQKLTLTPQEPKTVSQQEGIATACVPCCLGHFSASSGLLNEALRFKGEGIASNEILDRIAKVLEEQNTLERVDLAPEKISAAPPWERKIAEEALQQSRSLRHRLETIKTIEELEQMAVDTGRYYRQLNREWFKQRFAHLGPEKAQRIAEEVGQLSPEDKERVLKRAGELIEKV